MVVPAKATRVCDDENASAERKTISRVATIVKSRKGNILFSKKNPWRALLCRR